MLRQHAHEIELRTRGRGFYEFTGEVEALVAQTRIQTGLVTLHLQHTSASLLIQENADPEVRRDLERFFSRLVPDGDALFQPRWAPGKAFFFGNTAASRTAAG